MSFHSEGTFEVIIKEVAFSEPRFDQTKQADPCAFDVNMLVETQDGTQSDWWRTECSNRFGRGNLAEKTQTQITMETLAKIGLPNNDLNQLNSLIGTVTTATTKRSESNGKTYYNVSYLGGSSWKPEALPQNEMQRRIAAMMGGGQQQPQQQQQSQQTGWNPQPTQQQQPQQQPQQTGWNPQQTQQQPQQGSLPFNGQQGNFGHGQ